MRGVSLRSRLNISNGETRLRPVIDGVNRLPFAHVGFALTRPAAFIPGSANTWLAIPLLTKLHDADTMVNAAGTRAVIPEDCDGFFVLQVGTYATLSSYNLRVRVNGTTVLEMQPTVAPSFAVTPPFRLDVGDVLTWELNTTDVGFTWPGQSVTSGNTSFPFLSIHRVGLLP
jgi:hypothetical protein